MLTTNAELVSGVLRGTSAADGGPVLAAVAATRSLDLIVDDILHALVHQARAKGHTWAEIGDVLHVTRQAAFQRFGSASVPDDDARVAPLVDAPIKAIRILEGWVHGVWEQVRGDFDERMRKQCSVEMLESGHRRIALRAGAFLELGTPVVTVRQTYTVVDVPIAFEKDDMNGRVVFNADERVAGFFVLPPESA